MPDQVVPGWSVADPPHHDVAEVVDPTAGVAVASIVDRRVTPGTEVAVVVCPVAVTMPEMTMSEVAVPVTMAVGRCRRRAEGAEGRQDEEREELAGTEHVDLLMLRTGMRP
jgi:hypothetical protein